MQPVQVTWHLGTDVKQFMPRLGAPITSITACAHDPAKFVVTHANNTVRVVSSSPPEPDVHEQCKLLAPALWGARAASLPARPCRSLCGKQDKRQAGCVVTGILADTAAVWCSDRSACCPQVNNATRKVECSVQGVQPPPRGLSLGQAAGQLLGGSGHLALPAGNASLQIYDPLTDRHVANIQASLLWHPVLAFQLKGRAMQPASCWTALGSWRSLQASPACRSATP